MLAINDSHATDELDTRIQALPQELQDSILPFTDAFEVPATILITKSYRPPVALQLSRKLRAKFAEEYYGRVVVVADDAQSDTCPCCHDCEEMYVGFSRWLRTLDESHVVLVRRVEFRIPGWVTEDAMPEAYARYAKQIQETWPMGPLGPVSPTKLIMVFSSPEGRVIKFKDDGKRLEDEEQDTLGGESS